MSRLIGSNSHGNKNEINIVEALEKCTYSRLNNNLKEFVKFIAVIVVLIMIKQVFDYLHGKREWYYLKYKGFSKKIVELK